MNTIKNFASICQQGSVFLLLLGSLIAINKGDGVTGVILLSAGILAQIGLDILAELKSRK